MLSRRGGLSRRGVATAAVMAAAAGWLAGDGSRFRYLPTPRDRRALDAMAEDYRARYRVAALSVAVGRAGLPLYLRAFGTADRETGEHATPASRFRIASISKPLTAVGIFTLIERGRLHLSDRVFGWDAVLGTDYGAPPYPPLVEQVTIDHLLTHSAGGWGTDDPAPDARLLPLDHDRLINWALYQAPLRHPPGTHFSYSNIGYVMLARVIEKLTGSGYADWMRQSVLARCGVADMVIGGDTPAARLPDEVRYYQRGPEDPYGVDLTLWDAAAGWIAAPIDLLRFVMHVDAVAGSENILRPTTIWTMTTASPAQPNYARGWRLFPAGGWYHTGFMPGVSAVMARRADGICWAACINTRGDEPRLDGDLDNMVAAMARRIGFWRA